MAIQYINTGTSPNKGDGDSLRSAFIKINQNFRYISSSSFSSGSTGNLEILDQAIYGTQPNHDISILPNGSGSVVVPSLTTPSLRISESNTSTTAYVGFVYYDRPWASDLIPGNYLSTGTFGMPYAVPAPYFVLSVTGDNSTINQIAAGDFCSAADSKTYPVLARGTGIYQNYIALDVTEYQLGEEQSNFGTEIHVTRNLNRDFTKFVASTGSGIILDCSNTELQVNGSIIPFEDNTLQSLGMPTRRWEDIWLGAGGINIEDTNQVQAGWIITFNGGVQRTVSGRGEAGGYTSIYFSEANPGGTLYPLTIQSSDYVEASEGSIDLIPNSADPGTKISLSSTGVLTFPTNGDILFDNSGTSTISGLATLEFANGTTQTTAYKQGVFTFDIDGTNTVTSISSILGNLLIVKPAIGYTGSDTHSVTLPSGTGGQRLVIHNQSTLCDFVIDQGLLVSTIAPQARAEFIYDDILDQVWIPLYGIN